MGYLVFGWILKSWFTFCCQFLRRNNQFSTWTAKHSSQELSYRQRYTDRGYLIFISPAYQIKPLSLHVKILLSRAQLEPGSDLQLVTMSTMILDSVENIRLREQRSLWTKSALDHSCFNLLEAPAASKTSRHPFRLFVGSRALIFVQRWTTG